MRRRKRKPLGMIGGIMDAKLIDAWRQAGTDLGIRVEPRADAVLVRDFGGQNGMLCALEEEGVSQEQLTRQADALRCGWSVLTPFYLKYNREAYVDMLNDWQWTGAGDPPAWYTGQSWTD